MPGSCSSNTLNGCASCGPTSFYLFYLDASTSKTIEGFGCLDGSPTSPTKRYLSKSSSANQSVNESRNDDGPTQTYNLSISESSSENITCLVDSYGVIIYTSASSSSYSANGSSSEGPYKNSGSGSSSCTKVARKSSCDPEPPTICDENLDNCDGSPGFCQAYTCLANGVDDNQTPCIVSESCTEFKRNGTVEEYFSQGESYYNYKNSSTDQAALAAPQTMSDLYGICNSSVDKKVDILKDNKSQDCNGTTCGEGKDACWQLYSAPYFFIADNGLSNPDAISTTAQKLKFKIATIKEGFDKTYKSVSGTVKFYYGGTGGKTPCCNDDFDGTVLKEAGYSISAGSTFKNILLASDAGDLDNNDQSAVGQAIYICSTVDSLSFI